LQESEDLDDILSKAGLTVKEYLDSRYDVEREYRDSHKYSRKVLTSSYEKVFSLALHLDEK
jgi:hypothetical protein